MMMMMMMAMMMMMMALSYEVWVRAETEAGVGKPTKPVTTRLEQRGLHQTQFHIYRVSQKKRTFRIVWDMCRDQIFWLFWLF